MGEIDIDGIEALLAKRAGPTNDANPPSEYLVNWAGDALDRAVVVGGHLLVPKGIGGNPYYHLAREVEALLGKLSYPALLAAARELRSLKSHDDRDNTIYDDAAAYLSERDALKSLLSDAHAYIGLYGTNPVLREAMLKRIEEAKKEKA